MSRKCGENYIWSRKEKRCVRMRGYKGEVPEDIRADIMDRLTALAKYKIDTREKKGSHKSDIVNMRLIYKT